LLQVLVKLSSAEWIKPCGGLVKEDKLRMVKQSYRNLELSLASATKKLSFSVFEIMQIEKIKHLQNP
jgi:hypothetical protein